MSNVDLYNESYSFNAIEALNYRTNGTDIGYTVDTKNYQSMLLIIFSGYIANGTHTFELYESDSSDMSGEALVSSDFYQGTIPVFTSGLSDKIYRIGYVGKKRYVRIKCVTTGATTGGRTFGVFIGVGNRVVPTDQQT